MALSLASSSSSSTPATHPYDVFISFRGEDVRHGFLSHLQAALQDNQIKIFRDNGMEKGAAIWDELLHAVRNAKSFLVIFSKNYAFSTWCLKELVQIMERKKENEHVTVIPVFYGIEPTDVRKQTGTYHTAFAKHEGSLEDPCHVQQWRTALAQAADLCGFRFDEHRDDEATLTRKIVKAILQHCANIKYYMDGRNIPFICNRNYTLLESLLMRRELEEVVVIGIWGMGGIGKSTIAERLFNKYSCEYESSCFLTNSRELAKPCLNDICSGILSQLSNQDLHITNIGVLDSRIMSKLKQWRVFIVLDGVVDSSIAIDLVPSLRSCLCPGSIVILTTRDRSVLTSGGIDDEQIHEIQKMSYGESHKLFTHYAFSGSHHKEGYDELTARVINYASGVPLALKILGSFLRGCKKASEWDSALKKLRKYPNKNIQQVLRLSYDGLDDEEKKILLDIACFFVFLGGEIDIDNTTETLNSCGFSADIGIKNLLDKALISTIENRIKIHGLIQTMCREIVQEEARSNCGQPTRIWDAEELCSVLENKRRTQEVESIIVNMNEVSVDQRLIILDALKKMSNLRLLAIDDKIVLPQSRTDNLMLLPKNFKLPNKLRCVYWRDSPSLSRTHWPQKLVKLYIGRGKIQKLWDRGQNLPSLESIHISRCSELTECPNLEGSPNLKSIILYECKSLSDVDPSIFSLPKIETIDVSHCKALKRLCSDYCSPSLRRFFAVGCSNLEVFSVPIRAHHPKGVLYLPSTALSEVPTTVLDLKDLNFSFSITYSLEKLPSNFAKQIVLRDPQKHEDDARIVLSRILCTPVFLSVKTLEFFRCKSLSKLPDNIDDLRSVQKFWVTECPLITLPKRIKNLPQLEDVAIMNCEMFQHLPPLPSSVFSIRTMECKSLETISSLTSELPLRSHRVMFRFYNSMNLDEHAYEAVLKDLKSRMVLPVLDGDSNDFFLSYYIPYKSNMPSDCFPEYCSREASEVIVEVPPDRWISSAGLVFYLRFSQDQSCDLHRMIFRCKCYLKNSCNEWEPIASSFNQQMFGIHSNGSVLPLKMKSDHIALLYNAKCCNNIKKAIKEGKSSTACNPTLRFVFYAQAKDSAWEVALVTKECGIRWMHVDSVKDKGKSIQHDMGVVEVDQGGNL